ncbi:MAG: DUF255 domain-containing protein [Agriterribacter sp.]
MGSDNSTVRFSNTAEHNIVQKESEKLQWMTLADAAAKIKTEKKPILIDLYTSWCGWCKVMDKNTYTNPMVIKYIEDNFYPVKLDAETKETLTWKGKQFNYNPAYKVNEYAVELTGGQLSFPTTIILPADGSAPQAIPGYLKIPDMELILKYFGEGYFGKTPFAQYHQSFTASWK